MRTLVVDHQSTRRDSLCTRIARLGPEAVGADSGTNALKSFLAERPDLVLLRIDLPDITGGEVARRLRALEGPGEWTPIILLAAPEHEDDLARALAAGGDDFLPVPISEAGLGAKLRSMQRLIQMRHSMMAMTRKLDHANRELQRLSAIDGLTEIANRRHFDVTLAREWRRSMRQRSALSLIICDVDHFKRYNDTHGHQAGDDCLRRIAALLESVLERGGDLAARYGGEEFALILPETGIEGALRLAERLHERVGAEALPHVAAPLGRVSLSIGVASAIAMPDTLPDALLRAADEALYRSKADGRNRVTAAPSARIEIA